MRKIRRVRHAFRHERSVKVRAQSDVIGADESHRMIDMFDDFLPLTRGHFPASINSSLKRCPSASFLASFSPHSLVNRFHA